MVWHAIITLCGLFSLAGASIPLQTGSGAGISGLPQPSPTSGHGSGSGATQISTTWTQVIPSRSSEACDLSPICCGPRTITRVDDLRTLSACSTFQDNLILRGVAVSTTTASGSLPTLVIPVGTIRDGGLEISEAHVQDDAGFEISLNNLTLVNGDIAFVHMTNLVMPQFPSDLSVEKLVFQDIQFNGSAQFTTEGMEPSSVDPTSVLSVQGISFIRTNVNAIGPYNLNSASILVDIQNNERCERITLPTLASLGTGTIGNNNLLTALDLAGVDEFIDLEIKQNPVLADLNLNSLQTVEGTLSVVNNGKLKNIAMPELADVQDGVTLKGPINSVRIPAIPGLSGKIDIVSSGTLNCTSLAFGINAMAGHVHCTSHLTPGSASAPSSSPSSSPASSGSSHPHSSSGLSSGASIGIGVGVGVGGALLLALAIFFCVRSRRKNSQAPRTGSSEHAGYSGKGNYYTYREVPYELGSTKQMRKEPHSEPHTPPSLGGMSDAWVPPEPGIPTMQGRTELEEQQGQRHEMDARSIDFSDDDEEAETRSLEDIERVHRKG